MFIPLVATIMSKPHFDYSVILRGVKYKKEKKKKKPTLMIYDKGGKKKGGSLNSLPQRKAMVRIWESYFPRLLESIRHCAP